MEAQPPPPVVTISDPLHPGTPTDVMVSGNEREPWRATRKHYEALAVVLALVAAVVLPAKVVSARASDHRAALAEADAAAVTTGSGEGGVLLTNDSNKDVTLLEFTLLADGYRPVLLKRTVKALASTVVTVPDTRTCDASLMRNEQSGRARLRLRTSHGTEVTRTVELLDAWLPLLSAAQKRCGWLPPEQALQLTASLVRDGSQLMLRGTVHNQGKARLYVDQISFDDASVESQLPARITLDPGATKPYSMTLKLSSCPVEPAQRVQSATAFVSAASDTNVSGATQMELAEGALLQAWFDEKCP